MAKRGKYGNMQVMRRDPSIVSSLPLTEVFTSHSLVRMLSRHGCAIVKPTYGSGGAGVIKITKQSESKYLIEVGTKKISMKGKQAALAYLKRYTQSKPYIVQRYIPLAKVAGRPTDYRVMVQRKIKGSWTVTGKLAKVAGGNHIITNIARSKGYVLPAKTALTKSFSLRKSTSIMTDMNRIGLRAAKQLGQAYGFRIIGFDMGVDHKGNIWVLESNSRPTISLFLKLKDKSQYRTIIRNK